ncbi:hypothetical protein EG829_19175, partial [bacterium]|nr:hypothetical protein [bacterium]
MQPSFDPDGKYLYFLTNRTLAPVYSDFDNTWIYPNTTNLAAVPLTDDVLSPLAPKNDTTSVATAEGGDKEKKEDPKGGSTKGKTEKPKETTITLTGFEARLVT